MEISSRNGRGYHSQSSSAARQRQSGYEPSDTETDWPESPPLDQNRRNGDLRLEGPNLGSNQTKRISSFRLSRRESAKFEVGLSSPIRPSKSPARRRQSKSPFKPRRDDGNMHLPAQVSDFQRNGSSLSPKFALDSRKNVSPFSKLENPRFISPFKPVREGNDFVNNEMVYSKRKNHHRQLSKDAAAEGWGSHSQLNEISRVSEKSTYGSRSVSAPRPRLREKDQQIKYGRTEQNGDKTPSPLPRNMLIEREASHAKTPSVGELNEMVANAKISRAPFADAENFQSTDSISQGDIFFSRDYADLSMTMQKIVFPQNDGVESTFIRKPTFFTGKDFPSQQRSKANGSFGHKNQGNSSSTPLTRTTTTSSPAVSRHSSDKISTNSSVPSSTSGNFRKFIANRKKSQAEAWFSCIKKGSCRTSSSPERNREIDEASFIEKAFVVQSLRQFWADKHQPASLNGFTCHKQQAQVLKQLASHKNCPHILLKGPSGSGKKALTMALLREIFGEPAWDISHDLRYFRIQESRPMQVFVPITSSAHHVELNVYLEPNVRYALMALVKQISSSYAITPDISTANFKTDYKVMVLYEVDKAAGNIQHLIKWIMDCYTESCKLILCCEDDANILEPVKSLCKVIKVDAPVTHEIMEVLIQIARKEDFELPMSFAAKIANKSKQNLRKAIMALEACKAHNYPFVDDQPIPLGWEEVLEEIAAEILADPSQKRLFSVRGKFQKLLLDFVHPKLILQKLVEQFLKGVDASLKRELYYWHAYYDKRLPTGTSALLKLEEFVAKFMSMLRKKSNNPQYYS